ESNHVYLIFAYHTGDAAGQNMVTFCTSAICDGSLATTPIRPVSWFLEANMSGDKKATVLSFLHTRGRHVMAEVTLPRKLVERGLHTTPERMSEYWRMSFVGGSQTGSIGVSGHVANGIAALFLACGQDLACVSECSIQDGEQAAKLAEICAAVALAGEISIVGAICAGDFARAHERLG